MPRADAAVTQLAREALTAFPVANLTPGQRVLCFQPPDVWDRPEYLFCKSRILNNPLERSTGWWVGTVASIDTSNGASWVLVADRSGKTWDYDGTEFPLYPVDNLPENVAHIFQISDDLGALIRPPRPRRNARGETPPQQGPSLENEFFNRGGDSEDGPPREA